MKPIHKPQSLIVRIEGRVCFANSVYLGFRTCWSSEDWPTVTKGISDIGLRKEQALEKEIKNDVTTMEKRNKNRDERKLKNSRSKKSSQRALY